MNIVIEGANGTGKSTLAEELGIVFGLQVIHANGPSKTEEECLARCIRQEALIDLSEYVFDRTQSISFLVYQEYDAMIERKVYGFAEHLADNCKLIYCVGQGKHDYSGKPHYDEKLKNQVDNDQEGIRNMYEEVMQGLPHLRYDFESGDILKLIEEIKQ